MTITWTYDTTSNRSQAPDPIVTDFVIDKSHIVIHIYRMLLKLVIYTPSMESLLDSGRIRAVTAERDSVRLRLEKKFD